MSIVTPSAEVLTMATSSPDATRITSARPIPITASTRPLTVPFEISTEPSSPTAARD